MERALPRRSRGPPGGLLKGRIPRLGRMGSVLFVVGAGEELTPIHSRLEREDELDVVEEIEIDDLDREVAFSYQRGDGELEGFDSVAARKFSGDVH